MNLAWGVKKERRVTETRKQQSKTQSSIKRKQLKLIQPVKEAKRGLKKSLKALNWLWHKSELTANRPAETKTEPNTTSETQESPVKHKDTKPNPEIQYN